MIGAFSFKDIPSSNFNLICRSVTRPLLPTIRSSLNTLPRSSGVFDSGGTEYDTREITMRIQYLGTDFYELRNRSRDIAAWLGGGQWGKLIIIGEESKYYWGKIEEEIDLETIFEYGQADVTWICQPFAYDISDMVRTGVSPIIFNYPGTRYIDFRSPPHSKFDIQFQGPGEFTINGATLGYSGTNIVTIDNVEMRIIGDVFSTLTGAISRFLRVNPGANSLSYSNATNVRVTIKPMYY